MIASRRELSTLLQALVLALVLTVLLSMDAASPARADETVNACPGSSNVFAGWASGLWGAYNSCSLSGGYEMDGPGVDANAGRGAGFNATVPPGLAVRSIVAPWITVHNAVGTGFVAQFQWDGGGYRVADSNGSFSWGGLSTSHVYMNLFCNGLAGGSTCPYPTGNGGGAHFLIHQLHLTAADTVPPWLGGDGLWSAAGWVRGTFPLRIWGDSPAGICSLHATLDGRAVPPSAGEPIDQTPDQSTWHQCSLTRSDSVITSNYGDGSKTLAVHGVDATGYGVDYNHAVHIDNQPVAVALSGPTDAPTTDGTQYVTATGSAGPSGVAGIACSTDGAPYGWHSGSSVRLPVQGLGQHGVSCYAENNALDQNGNHAISAIKAFAVSIRRPTVIGAFFTPGTHPLRCKPRHHKRCRPGASRGTRATKRVAFGKPVTVNGWLGTTDGKPLGGRGVALRTAPDDGHRHFATTANTVTRADGSWSATLPRGPSRLVQASYSGDALNEPASSRSAHVLVPARVLMHVDPTHTSWGGTINISGRVLGGHIPGKRQQLLRLRIGVAGIFTTVGIPDVSARGIFHTTFTFSPGHGTVDYWFSVSTLREAAYPYAPGSSRRVTVSVG